MTALPSGSAPSVADQQVSRRVTQGEQSSGGASGFPSAEHHTRLLQRHFTTHPQGARRVSDNQLVTEPTLWDGVTPGYEGLLDVNFRVGRFGRFESEIRYLYRCVRELGLTALYVDNDRFWSGAQGADFGAAPYVPFWEAVQELGIPVLWDIRFPQRRTHADYLGEVARLHRFARQFPRIRSVLTHGLPAHAFADGRLPDEVVALLE